MAVVTPPLVIPRRASKFLYSFGGLALFTSSLLSCVVQPLLHLLLCLETNFSSGMLLIAGTQV